MIHVNTAPFRREFWQRVSLRAIMAAATLFALTLSTSSARAGGGIGEVRISDMTATEMTVSWSFPAKYRGTDFYVCAKHADAWEGACDDDNSHPVGGGFDARSYRLTGLDPGREYKIKVISYNMMKNGKHAKRRKIGTSRAKTLSNDPLTVGSAAFWVTGSGAKSLSVAWKFHGTGSPSGWRLCIKRRFSTTMLHQCRWMQNNPDNKTTFDFPAQTNSYTFTGLELNANYKVYLIYVSMGNPAWDEVAQVRGYTHVE